MPSFTPDVAAALYAGPWRIVVTGAGGWLGRVTLAMLQAALGDRFAQRVTALGSRAGNVTLPDGAPVPVEALVDWQPPAAPLLVYHYAFLTKDRVASLSSAEYAARNAAIRDAVLGWLRAGRVAGAIVPSSGAVYDYLRTDRARDPDATLYGRLKWEDEEIFAAECAAHGVGLVLPRVFNLAGPCINKFDSYALASFIVQALQGNTIEIRARRPVLRSYYYVGDLVQLCTAILLGQQVPEAVRFDTAGDDVVELGALAAMVAETLAPAGGTSAAVLRAPLDPALGEDRYVGARAGIAALERACALTPLSLAAQVAATADDIRRALRGTTL